MNIEFYREIHVFCGRERVAGVNEFTPKIDLEIDGRHGVVKINV